MELSAVKAEMSSHADVLAGIAINANIVSEIDRHIKEVERQLNERLVHVSAKTIIQNYLPEITTKRRQHLATKVDDDVWESLCFGKNWYHQIGNHEELSFQKCTKGYAFYYVAGEVLFDLGVVECDGVDWYVRVIEDRRETYKVTGAPVEIKLRAFQHFSALLNEIANQTGKMSLEPTW